jgi:hypothetical protein
MRLLPLVFVALAACGGADPATKDGDKRQCFTKARAETSAAFVCWVYDVTSRDHDPCFGTPAVYCYEQCGDLTPCRDPSCSENCEPLPADTWLPMAGMSDADSIPGGWTCREKGWNAGYTAIACPDGIVSYDSIGRGKPF